MNKEDFYVDYAKNLKGEYKEAFDKISIYVASATPPGDDVTISMNEILDLLLSAQEDHRSVETVIGKDVEYFCDQMIKSNARTMIERIFDFCKVYRVIALFTFFIIGFDTIVDYVDGVSNPWIAQVRVGAFLSAVLISIIIMLVFNYLVKKVVFKFKWYNPKLNTLFTVIIFISLFIAVFTYSDKVDSLIQIPRWIMLLLLLLFYFVTTAHKKKQVKKNKKENRHIYFDDMVLNANIDQLQKHYQKYMKRCAKKQREARDVRVWYENKYKKDSNIDKLVNIGFIGINVIMIMITALNSDLLDTIIFSIILIIVESSLFRLFYKGRKARIRIYELIQEKDSDIFDESLRIDL